MISLPVLARHHTILGSAALEHLQRLIASWALLADLSFADLLLYAPHQLEEADETIVDDDDALDHAAAADADAVDADAQAAQTADADAVDAPNAPSPQFVVLGQIRPTTGQTLYREDQVGRVVDERDRPIVARAWALGEIVDDEITIGKGEWARIQAIPVRCAGELLAVLTREAAPIIRRKPGELEQVYVEIFDRFSRMIAAGQFPFAADDIEPEEAPRVGDGSLLLDSGQRVEYASPNAVSTLHRMGIHSNTQGVRLGQLGFDESPVDTAFATHRPFNEEIEKGNVIVLVRAIPLLDHDEVTGALVLVRDVSDVRRRDRLLVSKDTTIREIHHRVKNNLQTISSLLRLQSRRLESEEAKAAVEESVRRIRAIALVHDLLSRAPSEQVPFSEVVRPLVRMVEEGLVSPDRKVRFVVEGDAGDLGAEVATPLAVVITELLQNTVDHAFPEHLEGEGEVLIAMRNDGVSLAIDVQDNGVGLPTDFSLERPNRPGSLGLTIVRALVESELNGTIDLVTDGGARVELRVPAKPPPRVGT